MTIPRELRAPPAPPPVDLSQKVAELEARLAQLESVLKVGAGGTVTLKATTAMNIEAAVILTLKGGLITLN